MGGTSWPGKGAGKPWRSGAPHHSHTVGSGDLCPGQAVHPPAHRLPPPAATHLLASSLLRAFTPSIPPQGEAKESLRAGPGPALDHLNDNRKPSFQTTLQTRLYKGKMRMCNRCLLQPLQAGKPCPLSTQGLATPAQDELASDRHSSGRAWL